MQDAEGTGLLPGHHDRGHGEVRVPVLMEIQHLQIVHFVDVVPGEDQDLAGAFLLEEHEVLEDGVCGAPVPAVHHDLLGGHGIDVFPQIRAHDIPGHA